MTLRPRFHISWRVVACTAVIGGVIGISLYKVPTTFNITANSQIYDIVIGESHRSMWRFRDAEIFYGYETEGRPFTGNVRILPGTRVTFERTGSGPLRLRCEASSDGGTIARLYEANDEAPISVNQRLVLVTTIPTTTDGDAYEAVLPMSGLISLGMIVGDELSDPPTLLLDGEVSMHAHTFIGKRRYEAGRVSLDMGDVLDVRRHGDAYGFLVLRQQAGLSLIFRVVAKSLRVSRFGSQGYEVYASPLTRLKHDHALQAIWASSLFIVGLLAKWRPQKLQEAHA